MNGIFRDDYTRYTVITPKHVFVLMLKNKTKTMLMIHAHMSKYVTTGKPSFLSKRNKIDQMDQNGMKYERSRPHPSLAIISIYNFISESNQSVKSKCNQIHQKLHRSNVFNQQSIMNNMEFFDNL